MGKTACPPVSLWMPSMTTLPQQQQLKWREIKGSVIKWLQSYFMFMEKNKSEHVQRRHMYIMEADAYSIEKVENISGRKNGTRTYFAMDLV
jgi:hypothetical protein